MTGQYILIGQTPVLCEDLLEWGEWLEHAEKRVAFAQVGAYDVSTVFLGLDHRFGNGPPLLFETIIFLRESRQWRREPGEDLMDHARRCGGLMAERGDSELTDYARRYSDWTEAERGHEEAVRFAEERTGTARDAAPDMEGAKCR